MSENNFFDTTIEDIGVRLPYNWEDFLSKRCLKCGHEMRVHNPSPCKGDGSNGCDKNCVLFEMDVSDI